MASERKNEKEKNRYVAKKKRIATQFFCVVKMGPQLATERASDCRFKVGGKVKHKKETLCSKEETNRYLKNNCVVKIGF